MATLPLHILVRRWIRTGLETEFEPYESKLSSIMACYGGVIDRAIRALRVSEGSDGPFEVRLLKFPSRAVYDAHLIDPERRSLSSERDDGYVRIESMVRGG